MTFAKLSASCKPPCGCHGTFRSKSGASIIRLQFLSSHVIDDRKTQNMIAMCDRQVRFSHGIYACIVKARVQRSSVGMTSLIRLCTFLGGRRPFKIQLYYKVLSHSITILEIYEACCNPYLSTLVSLTAFMLIPPIESSCKKNSTFLTCYSRMHMHMQRKGIHQRIYTPLFFCRKLGEVAQLKKYVTIPFTYGCPWSTFQA